MHKYPVLKWFSKTARKKIYLWSFRLDSAIPAIYSGCVLALLPLYGLQLPIALLLAFVLKANLPILSSLQFITNPLTIFPIYLASYQVGRVVLSLFKTEVPQLGLQQMVALYDDFKSGDWISNALYFWHVWLVTALGGFILGLALATIGSAIYKIGAREVASSYERLKHLQASRNKN